MAASAGFSEVCVTVCFLPAGVFDVSVCCAHTGLAVKKKHKITSAQGREALLILQFLRGFGATELLTISRVGIVHPNDRVGCRPEFLHLARSRVFHWEDNESPDYTHWTLVRNQEVRHAQEISS